MKVVIMAGGKGTRIASVVHDIPKPMIPIAERPVLEHQLCCLKKQNLTDIIFVVGHLGNIVKDYFKDGSQFGVHINYYCEETPLGTAGALYFLKKQLNEDFLLLNGDIIFDVDFSKMIAFHKQHNASATLLTHPNSHPYDSALIATDEYNKVTTWMNKEEPRKIYKNRVNAGIHILSPAVLANLAGPQKTDLDRDILKPLVSGGQVFAYDSPEYVKDMGTPERYYQICDDFKKGKIQAKNLYNKQKAVFLDRDGTINQYCGFVTSPDQLTLIDGAATAIQQINASEYLAIVVTNQPVIARGDCTFEELGQIHNELETRLGDCGAYLDDLFYCPHHPDRGFEGEYIEYKIQCDCRKPKPGMLFAAAEKYNIDLTKSYMVGDSMWDAEAGRAAGCQSILLTDSPAKQDNGLICYKSLLEFVQNNITD